MTLMDRSPDDLLSMRQRLVAELAAIDQALSAIRLPQAEDDDLIPIGVAATRARRNPQTIRRWCENFGLGVMVAGRYQISSRRLTAHLKQKKL